MTGRVRTGRRGEDLAARHLEEAGHRVLERNWRSGHRELDLVTLDGHTVAFVEVKTRRPGPQPATEALGPRQRRHLRKAAEAWIHAHPGIGREFRFDIVTVELRGAGPPRIRHLPDAFYGDP